MIFVKPKYEKIVSFLDQPYYLDDMKGKENLCCCINLQPNGMNGLVMGWEGGSILGDKYLSQHLFACRFQCK